MTLLLCFLPLLLFILPPAQSTQYQYETKYVSVPLDHFNFLNNKTFKIRYLENSSYWKPSWKAPIFFYTGNEADINTFAQNTGLMWDFGQDFKALLIFAEHRYYGESLPFGNKSFTDKSKWGYLSSSQALADFVYVLDDVRQRYNISADEVPTIAFGGSYGGMLAAWMRMKYPAQITGALASSAPIWQFTDLTPCEAFNNVVSSVYKDQSNSCFETIKHSWSAFDRLVSQGEESKQWISKNLKLCRPLNTEEEVGKFKEWLSLIWVNLAMLNYPYSTDFLTLLPAFPVKEACLKMQGTHTDDKAVLLKVFQGASVFFNTSGKAVCTDTNAGNGNLPDTYDIQACTEMIMPMCATSDSMFELSSWDIAKVTKDCQKKYGATPQPYLVKNIYGGRDISAASNIIFSNGRLDPWSSGGVLFNISRTVRAVIIPESAHHLDLRSSNPVDPVSVRKARTYYRYIFKMWIKQHHLKALEQDKYKI